MRKRHMGEGALESKKPAPGGLSALWPVMLRGHLAYSVVKFFF